MRFATRAIHIGQDPDPTTGATVPPIYATSTYTQEAPGRHKGFEYSRTHNPTRSNLEAALAALEGGQAAAAFASGLAATNAILSALLRPGDSVVAYNDMYGGTYRLLERVYRPWGLETRYADSTDPAAIAALVDRTTRLVWIETPTNPMLRVLDISGVAQAVRAAAAECGTQPMTRRGGSPMDHDFGLLVVVDNTFASPALQLPLALGADLVLHSTTKYIGGHSDLVGGAVVAARAEVLTPIRFFQNAAGGVPGPFDCFLAQRGIKTLAIRMRAHCANAQRIAEWAAARTAPDGASQRASSDGATWGAGDSSAATSGGSSRTLDDGPSPPARDDTSRPVFEKVIYPGLPGHPDHDLARRQMCGFGGMVTLVLRGGLEAASRFMSATKLFACAESLGGVESLINHPAIMTHASMPPAVRERIGIVDGLVRLSVGIEDVEDLIADLEQAAGKAAG